MLLPLLKSENKVSNTYTKKTFSSANLSLLLCFIFAAFTYLFITVTSILSHPIFEIICLSIILICFSLYLYIRFPLFIDPNPAEKFSEDFYDHKYEKNLGWFKNLYFTLFTAERSQFVSFFSGSTIKLYVKGRVCKFTWETKPVKPVHRLLDFLLFLILGPTFCLLMVGLLNFGILSGISVCIIGLLFLFRKRILFSFLSVNVGKAFNYKLNVVYPYSTSNFHLHKYYGTAEPFTKTVLIADDTFSINPVIKKYVTVHEVGHLKDKKTFWTYFFVPIFVMIYLTILPYLLKTANSWAAFIPLVTYFIYTVTLGYKFREKSEFSADEFALKSIGKENCIEALRLMNTYVNSGSRHLFLKPVPLERKIQFINDYEEKKT